MTDNQNESFKDQPSGKEERKPVEGAIADWRDISSAPRDGTDIILCDARVRDCMVIAFYEDSYDEYVWHVADSCAYHHQVFTHWMPLPPAPYLNPDHPASVGSDAQ